VPEAPDFEFLARALLSALDIANDADRAVNDWNSALHRTDAIIEIKQELQRTSQELAATRLNRAGELLRLGRFPEAKAELDVCLQVFHSDPPKRAVTLSSLADLFDKQGDVYEAIIQQRRALALCEQLPGLGDRAISHGNLANYLERSGTLANLAESPLHRLAALVYQHVSGMGQNLQTSLRNFSNAFRRAQASAIQLSVPRLADLLADPAFHTLEDWLHERQADLAEVQAAVDQLLDQVRQAASAHE
jgi:tetratricopeptide (TPR) repeat protein